jgi:hypothetical protein
MELSTELLAILMTIIIGWVGWISTATIRNQQALSKLNASDVNLHNDMEGLKEGFISLKDDVKEQIAKVNSKLDIFLKDEISVLKELAKK